MTGKRLTEDRFSCSVGFWSTAITALFAVLAGPLVAQQQHKGSPQKLAVDAVRLNSNKFLYGIVTDQTNDEVQLLVERKWLDANHPEILQRAVDVEQARAANAARQIVQRIDQWLERRADEPVLRVFLEDERNRLAALAEVADPPQTRFVIVPLSASDVRSITCQENDRHQIAGIAWKHALDNVATRSADSLQRELERNGVDIGNESFDFSDQVPTRTESAHDWATRQALVEYEMMDPLRFQGTGTSFFRSDERPGLADLIGQLGGIGGSLDMVQQVGEELGIPEFTAGRQQREKQERDWWKKPAAIADEEGVLVFQVTRLHQRLLDDNSSVSSHLFSKLPDGSWREVFRANVKVSTAGVDDGAVDALREDPQIKQIVETFGALGLGNVDNRLEQALRQGAATNTALNKARGQIAEFTGRYRNRLDSPPVPTNTK